MALRRRVVADEPGSVGSIPEPFRTRLHPMWADPDAIADFCRVHGLSPTSWLGPLTAFKAVAEAYAVARGWVKYYGGNSRPFADLTVMSRNGVPLFWCSLFGREAHGMLGRDLTADEWEWIADTERRVIEKLKDGLSNGVA